MSELTPELAAEIIEVCTSGKDEIAEGLGRALDAAFEITFGESGTFDAATPPDGVDGAGLMVVMVCDGGAAVLVVPESTGVLPEWYTSPDPTGVSKLMTLAQELGMLILPESAGVMDFLAGGVKSIGESLTRGEAAESAGLIPIELKAGDESGTAYLIWPLAKADAVLEKEEAKQEETPASTAGDAESMSSGEEPAAAASGAATAAENGAVRDFCDLPPYARSLLQIRVPVKVTLASKKQPVARILEMGPGSILQFNKSCDEVLSLEVGTQQIALGEAVKVGDRFGMRISQIELPEERFHSATQ